MQSSEGNRFSGVCAVLVGLSYLIIGITFFLLPEGQQPDGSFGQLLSSVVEDGSTLIQAQFWAFGLGALLALAVVFAVYDVVGPLNRVLVRWVSVVAVVGFAVVAVQFLLFQDQIVELATAYDRLDTQVDGIGLAFIKDRDGDITVHPYPRKPPPGGVLEGDNILAVNGKTIPAGATSAEAAKMILDAPGPAVTITLKTGDEAPREVSVSRGTHRFLALSTREAITIAGLTDIDPDNWMGFGTVGLWLLVVNWLAWRGRRFPVYLPYFGMVAGIAYLLVVGGAVIDQDILTAIAAGAAIMVAPVWYIGVGVFFWKRREQED